MDPLTHTLVGASLAATRLGQTTRRATAALVIGVNLPDLDVLSYVNGGDAALGFRRGWTHGVPALLLLPLLLALVLGLIARSRPADCGSPPLSIPRLAALSYLAVWTHPALDWLNTYGMRWWMPLRESWSYGDAVFIMDPWLWLILGVSWLLTRSRSRPLLLGMLIPTLLLLAAVAGRAPGYLLVAAAVLSILWLAALTRPPANARRLATLPLVGLALGALYIGALLLVQQTTEARVRTELAQRSIPVHDLMVGPSPARPDRWDVLVDAGPVHRYGTWRWFGSPALTLEERQLPTARASPVWPEVMASDAIPGFRRWTRFTWIEVETRDDRRIVHLMDARYARYRTGGFGGASLELPTAGSNEFVPSADSRGAD